MTIVDCVSVICGGCGVSIWTIKAYIDKPLCHECRVRLEEPYSSDLKTYPQCDGRLVLDDTSNTIYCESNPDHFREEGSSTPSGEEVAERSEAGDGESPEKKDV